MNPTKAMATTFFVAFIAASSWAGGVASAALVQGDVNTQFGEQRLEEACNELGVEWEYQGVSKIDGERVNPGLFDFPGLAQRTGPIAEENVTIRCHLTQGFLASTSEQVTVNATRKEDNPDD